MAPEVSRRTVHGRGSPKNTGCASEPEQNKARGRPCERMCVKQLWAAASAGLWQRFCNAPSSYWRETDKRERTALAFATKVLESAHAKSHLSARTNAKSTSEKLAETRGIWRSCHGDFDQLKLERELCLPANVPSGCHESQDERDVPAEMEMFKVDEADALAEAMQKHIPGPAKYFIHWKKIYWESGTAMAGSLSGDTYQR